MNIIKTIKETTADGPGIRYAIYVAGCTHYCRNCHNPQTWDFDTGEKLTPDLLRKIKTEIITNALLDGVTISGGDPLHPKNAPDTLWLLQELAMITKSIWVYTGYTIEELTGEAQKNCLFYIDVLVDGPYDDNQKDLFSFRGSLNQRYICSKEIVANL